jgi:autotransporter-associated beta strand protein
MRILFRLLVLSCVLAFLIPLTSKGGSGTWLLNPVDDSFDNAANWSSGTVPGYEDTATFAISSQAEVTIPANTSVAAIDFAANANAYQISVAPGTAVNVGGQPKPGEGGISNESSVAQNFLAHTTADGGDSLVQIYGAAGSENTLTAEPQRVSGGGRGYVWILDKGNAGNSNIVSEGGVADGAGGGYIGFYSGMGAAATIVNQAGTLAGATGGTTTFWVGSRAEKASITANGATVSGASGGEISFIDKSQANGATLIAQAGSNGGGGGLIQFTSKAQGGSSRVEVFGNGSLDMSGLSGTAGLTVGSLEGSGMVTLGSRNLTIGANGLSTTFSGTIQGTGAVLLNGSGTLTLSGASSYTGATTVLAGTLLIDNKSGSATGTGSIKIQAGTLGCSGSVFGAVTIGTGSGTGAVLATGAGSNGTTAFTTRSALTLKSDAACVCKLSTQKVKSDQVIADGITIQNGAQFDLQPTGKKRLVVGTVFTVMSNTSPSPISGTFANLSDGATLAVGKNRLLASYEGDDGNDLTLTVVQ